MLKLNNIYNMDVREGLKLLDAESIDCVITSPPYWSLRDYGIPPSIWGGDPDCEHNFKLRNIKIENHNGEGKSTIGSMKKGITGKHESKEGFCSKCGAWKGTLGLEPNFELFISNLCDIYDGVKRVLKKSGTCWVNLGDSYASKSVKSNWYTFEQYRYDGGKGKRDIGGNTPKKRELSGIKPKCLMMLPQRFAIEMINRGWILRNVIVWHKPNAMPSSARDRFTVDFEYVYFFVKAKKYWFEQQRERLSQSRSNQDRRKYAPATNSNFKNTGEQGSVPSKPFSQHWPEDLPSENDFPILKYTENELKENTKKKSGWEKQRDKGIDNTSSNDLYKSYNQWQPSNLNPNPLGKNKRTVWTIPTKPNPEAHFATFPPKLVMPMIKSGCPEFICKVCGKPREKIMKNTKEYEEIKEKWNHVNMGGTIKTGRNRKTGYPGHITKQEIFKGFTECGCKAPLCEKCGLPQKTIIIKNGEFQRRWSKNNQDGSPYNKQSSMQNIYTEIKSECICAPQSKYKPGVVLDIFAGTGTTLKEAFRQGRDYLGFEISEEYCKIANRVLKSTKNSRLDKFF